MSEESSPPKKKRRRWLRWILPVPVILAIVAFILSRDEELKPVDDLMPQRTEAAWDDNNGYKRLFDFADKITPLDKETQVPKLSGILSLELEPEPAEWRALALSDAELTELESIAGMPVFQDVLYDSLEAILKVEHSKCSIPNRRLQATIVSAMEEQQAPLVLRCLRLADRLARKQMAGATTGIGFQHGYSWLSNETVALALVRMDLNEAELKELASILEGDRVNVDESRVLLRHEFRSMYNEILSIDPSKAGSGWSTQYYFQRNRTANLLAGYYRATIPLTFTATWPELKKLEPQLKDLSGWTSQLEPNRIGILLVQDSYAAATWELILRYRNAQRRCMQVITALHRCQKARGSLPAKLDDLVPDFLPSVPVGPFHFEPLHWDAKFRALQYFNPSGTPGGTPNTNPKSLIEQQKDGYVFYFRTRAEEDARRAANPLPKTPVKLQPKSKKPKASPASGTTGP